MTRRTTWIGALLGATLAAGACVRPWMDLWIPRDPAGGADPIAFCRLDAQNRLVITVGNRGDEETPETITRVTFTTLPTGPHTIDLPTPAVGSEDDVTLPPIDLSTLPSNCHQPDCRFTIRVDAGNTVWERNESNNEHTGSCPG